jgi:hypothetical protein
MIASLVVSGGIGLICGVRHWRIGRCWRKCCEYVVRMSPIAMPSVTIFGCTMPNDTWPEWERVLDAATLEAVFAEE